VERPQAAETSGRNGCASRNGRHAPTPAR